MDISSHQRKLPEILGLRTGYVTLFNGNKTIYTAAAAVAVADLVSLQLRGGHRSHPCSADGLGDLLTAIPSLHPEQPVRGENKTIQSALL